MRDPDVDGHLFVVRADMLSIDCDAVLLPTGPEFGFSESWRHYLADHRSAPGGGAIAVADDPWDDVFDPFDDEGPWLNDERPWDDDEIVRDLGRSRLGGPELFAGLVATGYDEEFDEARAIDRARAAAVEFVHHASERVVPAEHRRNQPIRLALPLVGTGYSGLGRRTGHILGPLLEQLRVAAVETGADVLLCIVGDHDWSAVQQVRAAEPATKLWNLPEDLLDRAARIADHVRREDLVLFMGAGVGRDAGLPDWNGLLENLGARAGMTATELDALGRLDPRDRARLIERRMHLSSESGSFRDF
ncbi:MAG: hypothetical protein ACOYOQ_15780, partial [Microthrixaceae bacterium]